MWVTEIGDRSGFLAVTGVFGCFWRGSGVFDCGFWLLLWFLCLKGLWVVVGSGVWVLVGSWVGCGSGVWVVGDGVGVVVVVFGCDRCFWGWFLVVFGLGPVFLVVVF